MIRIMIQFVMQHYVHVMNTIVAVCPLDFCGCGERHECGSYVPVVYEVTHMSVLCYRKFIIKLLLLPPKNILCFYWH